MKVALIGFNDLQYIPYISKYISILDNLSLPYDIICWDRENTNNENPYNSKNFHRFCKYTPPTLSELEKMSGIMAYSNYIRNVLKGNCYDKLIMLATQSSVIISDVLLRKYKKRYIFDVRDYWHESFRPLQMLEHKLVGNAGLCVLSSKGFKEWLPNADWIVSHNTHIDELSSWLNSGHEEPSLFNSNRVILNYIGQIRYEQETKRIIDKLGGNENFVVNYYGYSTNRCDYAAYAKRLNATNVEFFGRYSHSERYELYERCDLVLSNYDARMTGERTLLNNKIYEAALALRPIIVSRGTFLEKMVTDYGLGLAIDTKNDDIGKLIFDYITAFDKRRFLDGCRMFLEDVLKDDRIFVASVGSFLTS